VFFVKRAWHLFLQNRTRRSWGGGCHVDGLVGSDATFAQEIAGAEQGQWLLPCPVWKLR